MSRNSSIHYPDVSSALQRNKPILPTIVINQSHLVVTHQPENISARSKSRQEVENRSLESGSICDFQKAGSMDTQEGCGIHPAIRLAFVR